MTDRGSQHVAPFESPSKRLLCPRAARRLARNLLLVIGIAWFAIDMLGEPLLRWEYRYRGHHASPQVIDATYIGMSGWRHVHANELGVRCPLVLFVCPDPPLWCRAMAWPTTLLD